MKPVSPCFCLPLTGAAELITYAKKNSEKISRHTERSRLHAVVRCGANWTQERNSVFCLSLERCMMRQQQKSTLVNPKTRVSIRTLVDASEVWRFTWIGHVLGKIWSPFGKFISGIKVLEIYQSWQSPKKKSICAPNIRTANTLLRYHLHGECSITLMLKSLPTNI